MYIHTYTYTYTYTYTHTHTHTHTPTPINTQTHTHTHTHRHTHVALLCNFILSVKKNDLLRACSAVLAPADSAVAWIHCSVESCWCKLFQFCYQFHGFVIYIYTHTHTHTYTHTHTSTLDFDSLFCLFFSQLFSICTAELLTRFLFFL